MQVPEGRFSRLRSIVSDANPFLGTELHREIGGLGQKVLKGLKNIRVFSGK
ncbi:MAG: hypothetical protein LBU25_10385 [Treponema sp.]|jgi:hypothetical protein|nr:hypothetical protein [Treponema sp.]